MSNSQKINSDSDSVCKTSTGAKVQIGSNLMRTCDFLLACHSNLGPILNRF